jgi:hypothetical protein
MMHRNANFRREARRRGHTIDPSRETFDFVKGRLVGPKPKAKAEGATAPETLRQKDREGDELLESRAAVGAALTEGVIRQRRFRPAGKSLRSK